MTILVEVRPEEERELRERARTSGRELPEYVQQVLEEHIRPSPDSAMASKTFDQILAPVREGWHRSGMTEEEITALFEETRDEVRKERRARRETS
jgi:hypothetical protein